MQFTIAVSALALLAIAFVAWINALDWRRRRKSRPQQRKDDDYDSNSFTQGW